MTMEYENYVYNRSFYDIYSSFHKQKLLTSEKDQAHSDVNRRLSQLSSMIDEIY